LFFVASVLWTMGADGNLVLHRRNVKAVNRDCGIDIPQSVNNRSSLVKGDNRSNPLVLLAELVCDHADDKNVSEALGIMDGIQVPDVKQVPHATDVDDYKFIHTVRTILSS
jgi:hypothetical protein